MKQRISKSNQLDHILYSIVGLALGGTLLSVLTLSSVHATTGTASDSKTSTASVTVSAACFMTANVVTAHTGTVPGGIWSGGNDYYPNGIGKTTIATFCNDASGYSMYAVGYTGDSTSGNNTVLHSATLGSGSDIATGTAKSGDTSNWAMRVTKVTDPSQSYIPSNLSILNNFDSEDYHAVPANYTEVARYSSTTDKTLGSKLETTYSAYIAANQPAGTYEGKVKYTLVHPGGSDAPDANTMQNVQYWGGSLAVGEEKTVTDSRDGQSYTVARLCTNYDSSNNCTSSQIWMTQNLNLQIGGTGVTLNSINTDLNNPYEPDGTTLKKDYSISGSTITWTPTTANTTASGVATNNTLTGTPATISSFDYSSSGTTVVSNWSNQNYYGYQAEGTLNGVEQYEWPGGTDAHGTLANCISAGYTEAVCNHYKIGNYYNFTAANAMSNSTGYQTAYSVMDNSICPKGWRLPKGLTSDGSTVTMSEFNQLLNAQGVTAGTDLSGSTNVNYVSGGYNRLVSTGIHGDPLYFARSGSVNGTTLYNSANYGGYWSSTVTPTATYGYYLSFYSGGIWPANQNYRTNGFSLRCVAR
ncbi:hypothetical protein IKE82_01690 [Candidatus Saccharibacteria bacterium]|nr:hypothetical protein [Candidatus Saccharibacteria bacterium]